ncbi:MAG: 30S ribosomal protein S6 [Deltaproteobacteria bacterium]|nr:30S ribosomal protein S6 [Deltaproteobacteria bacterium]
MAERTLEQPAKKWARNYETIYILRPNVEADDVAKVATRVKDVMDRMGGKLTKVDVWGKRRLAYNIGNFTRGIFVYLGYSAHGDLIAELERNLRLLDSVMRYQTIVVDERIDLDEVTVDASEVEWADIELGDDDDDEPTTAERLGMEERAEKAEAKSDDDSDEDSDDSDSDSDDDDDDSDDDDDDAKNEEE